MPQRIAISDAPETPLGVPQIKVAIPVAAELPTGEIIAGKTSPEAIAALAGGGGSGGFCRSAIYYELGGARR